MSRYALPPRRPNISVVCGWDNPLQTLFAIVAHEPEREDEDNVILWLGTSVGEIPRPADLVEPLKPYADIDARTIAALRRDRAEATAPTWLQRFGRSFGQ